MHAWTNNEKSPNFEIENIHIFVKTIQPNGTIILNSQKIRFEVKGLINDILHIFLTTILDDKSIIIDIWQTNTIRNAVDQKLKISSFCRNLTRCTLHTSFWHVQWFLKHEKQPKWIPGMSGHGGFANHIIVNKCLREMSRLSMNEPLYHAY